MNSAVTYAPRPKKPTCPNQGYPVRPPIRFHAVASATNMNTVPTTRSWAVYSWVCRAIPATAPAASSAHGASRRHRGTVATTTGVRGGPPGHGGDHDRGARRRGNVHSGHHHTSTRLA